jgi:hypothetical protein
MTDTGDSGGTGNTGDTPEEGGLSDLGGIFASAQQALSAQAEAAEQIITGTAGGGVVSVEMTGGGEVRSITISPDVVDPAEIDMLQDLVVAALHDAAHQVSELQRQALGGLGDLLGGMGGLPGLPGPGESP